MPYPRFLRLAEARRNHLLDIAAQEFAADGFAHASINRILERAGMSKGAAYYYFEDKADLFLAVVGYCSDQLHLIAQEVDVAALSAETFWPTFADLHRQPLLRSFDRPWLFGALKAAGRLPRETLEGGPLAAFARQIQAYARSYIDRGQALGMIRADLPIALIFAWIEGVDRACDEWLIDHWSELDRDAIARISDETVMAMRRAVVP
jgi:AcrR family transcriptional regulator